jgi:hypothetical protein
MKTQVIANYYDGPIKPVKKMNAAPIPLDYAYSEVASDIDNGIRDTIKGIRVSILAMGMGLAKIKNKGLYIDLDCGSMNQYVEKLCDETKMDRSSIFNWLSIGEAYIKYRNDLERVGFNDNDGPTKLPYIEKALETNRKNEVFKNIKDMSVREFKAFSRGEADEDGETNAKITVRDNEVYIGRTLAVQISDKLDAKTRSYFKKIILAAGNAMQEGEVILPVRLYDTDEMRRFERAADRLKKEMRGER